jgi:hypothetical protein
VIELRDEREVTSRPSVSLSSVTSNKSSYDNEEYDESKKSESSYEEDARPRARRGRKAQPRKTQGRKSENIKNKAYLLQTDFDVEDELRKGFDKAINNPCEEKAKSKRGRPANKRVVDDQNLIQQLKKWVKDLDNKIEKCSKSNRTDALDVTIKRKI